MYPGPRRTACPPVAESIGADVPGRNRVGRSTAHAWFATCTHWRGNTFDNDTWMAETLVIGHWDSIIRVMPLLWTVMRNPGPYRVSVCWVQRRTWLHQESAMEVARWQMLTCSAYF